MCKVSYHQYQAQMFSNIIKMAEESAYLALLNTLKYLKEEKKTNILPVGFNYSWSHARNTNQASSEFIFLENLPGRYFFT